LGNPLSNAQASTKQRKVNAQAALEKSLSITQVMLEFIFIYHLHLHLHFLSSFKKIEFFRKFKMDLGDQP
jgi:hypothetical protein